MFTVQITLKNSSNTHWKMIMRYATRRGVDDFLTKNQLRYPEKFYTIRVSGEAEKSQKFQTIVKHY